MSLSLSNLQPARGSKRRAKTIGRGGKRGTYSGRGLKGQKARSGGRKGLKRLGMRQLMERTHQLRGFRSRHQKPATVSLGTLNRYYTDGATVTPADLLTKKIVTTVKNGVKVLSNGALQIKIKVTGCAASAAAIKKIQAAGGEIATLEKQPVTPKSQVKTAPAE